MSDFLFMAINVPPQLTEPSADTKNFAVAWISRHWPKTFTTIAKKCGFSELSHRASTSEIFASLHSTPANSQDLMAFSAYMAQPIVSTKCSCSEISNFLAITRGLPVGSVNICMKPETRCDCNPAQKGEAS